MEALIKSVSIDSDPAILWPGSFGKKLEMEADNNNQRIDLPGLVVSEDTQQKSLVNADLVDNSEKPEVDSADIQYVENVQHSVNEQQVLDKHLLLLESLKENAMQQGYAEGIKKAESEARLKYEDSIHAFSQLTESAKAAMSAKIVEMDPLIGSIIYEVVCKILGSEAISKDACVNILTQVIRNLTSEEILKIKVSPGDYELILPHLSSVDGNISAFIEKLQKISIEVDASILLGGCIVVLKDGIVDATIETQLMILANSIKETIGQK